MWFGLFFLNVNAAKKGSFLHMSEEKENANRLVWWRGVLRKLIILLRNTVQSNMNFYIYKTKYYMNLIHVPRMVFNN